MIYTIVCSLKRFLAFLGVFVLFFILLRTEKKRYKVTVNPSGDQCRQYFYGYSFSGNIPG